jgi:helicase
MVKKKKSSKKQEIVFTPIEGLQYSDAEITTVATESTKDGECIPTTNFPYMKFQFENFNPMQSGCLQWWDKDVNLIVSSFTASGKTTVIEGIAAHTMSLGKKVIYTSPMKSLSNEKIADWENLEHDFSNKKVCILTGDVTRSDSHLQKLNEADLNILTSECLDVCCRNSGDSKYPWIKDTGALIVDESHFVGVPHRGDKIEASIINFAKLNPNARIIFLSATMPNIEDFKKWLIGLNGKETITYTSNYRPCDLEKIFVRFKQKNGATENMAKEELIYYFMQKNLDISYLAFVGSKKAGQSICNSMDALRVENKFFKADLSRDERIQLYNDFNDRKFKLMVSTSAASTGINLAARTVFVTATTFGPFEEISTMDLLQMAGRAGRPKYEKEGTAIFLLKESRFKKDYTRINAGEPVISQMNDNNILAFHVLAEIMNKSINCPIDLVNWYNKTLARHQSREMEIYEAKDIFARLERCGMINEMTDGTYVITKVGIVTAQMYLIPEDVAAWIRNFNEYFSRIDEFHSEKDHDLAISMALAMVPSWKNKTYVSADEKQVADDEFGIFIGNAQQKIGLCYWLCLNQDEFNEAMGRNPKARFFYQAVEALRKDVERIVSAMMLIDVRTHKWNAVKMWQELTTRFKYGCPRERLALCSLDGIGGARSKDLFDKGIRTVNDVIRNQFIVKEVLGDKIADKAINSARAMQMSMMEW